MALVTGASRGIWPGPWRWNLRNAAARAHIITVARTAADSEELDDAIIPQDRCKGNTASS